MFDKVVLVNKNTERAADITNTTGESQSGLKVTLMIVIFQPFWKAVCFFSLASDRRYFIMFWWQSKHTHKQMSYAWEMVQRSKFVTAATLPAPIFKALQRQLFKLFCSQKVTECHLKATVHGFSTISLVQLPMSRELNQVGQVILLM